MKRMKFKIFHCWSLLCACTIYDIVCVVKLSLLLDGGELSDCFEVP